MVKAPAFWAGAFTVVPLSRHLMEADISGKQ
jgi:hypothetical protein